MGNVHALSAELSLWGAFSVTVDLGESCSLSGEAWSMPLLLLQSYCAMIGESLEPWAPGSTCWALGINILQLLPQMLLKLILAILPDRCYKLRSSVFQHLTHLFGVWH